MATVHSGVQSVPPCRRDSKCKLLENAAHMEYYRTKTRGNQVGGEY